MIGVYLAYLSLLCFVVALISGTLHTRRQHWSARLPAGCAPRRDPLVPPLRWLLAGARRFPAAAVLAVLIVMPWVFDYWWIGPPLAFAALLWRRHRRFRRITAARRAEARKLLTGRPPRTSQQKWARKTIRRLDPGYGELLDTCAPLGEPLSVRDGEPVMVTRLVDGERRARPLLPRPELTLIHGTG